MADEATDTYDDSLDLIEVSSSAIYDDVIETFEDGVGEALYPGDERRIFAEALVAVLVAYASTANDASRQVLLRCARGQVLDAIGERLGVERLEATAAQCEVKFTLAAAMTTTITIPAGTRVTGDGEIYFATDKALAIAAGELSGTVTASCTEAGEDANGIAAGEITTLVDLQPYVGEVANTTETEGGDDGEPYTTEGDEHFRERIRLAPNKLSTAGPEQSYRYWALTADGDIADVAVVSETYADEIVCVPNNGIVYVGGDLLEPDAVLTVDGEVSGFTWEYDNSLLTITLEDTTAESVTVQVQRRMDGRVRIVPLMADGQVPDDDVLQAVYDTCNADTVRPMTDLVTVTAPGTVEYEIELKYWTTVTDEAAVVEAVEGSGGAVETYITEQCARLGRDVNPDMLISHIIEAGAVRCEVTSPEYTAVDDLHVATLSGTPSISHATITTARWDG